MLAGVTFYSNIENLVLPPGCKPYGPEAGPGFFNFMYVCVVIFRYYI
jgi:hypothetical protein